MQEQQSTQWGLQEPTWGMGVVVQDWVVSVSPLALWGELHLLEPREKMFKHTAVEDTAVKKINTQITAKEKQRKMLK